MPNRNNQADSRSLAALRKEWAVLVVIAFVLLVVGWRVLHTGWGAEYALRWAAAAGLISAYAFFHLWRNLRDNRHKTPGSPLFADLGTANRLTFARAIFNAMLVGFLFGPWPWGWLAWAPAVLYLVSALMDYVDGWVARVTGRTTVLGEALDMKWDGAGLLAAGTLSVLYGQTPAFFLLVGLARYLYLFGLWVQQRRGLPVYDLPPSRFRRAIAGMQMGFVAVVLLPLFRPPETHAAAVLFALPLLIGFVRDFLWVIGVIGRGSKPTPVQKREPARLQLALRGLLAALLVNLIFHSTGQGNLPPGLLIIAAVGAVLVLLGAAGRAAALAVLLMTGLALQRDPMEWRYWLILPVSTLVFFFGTGVWSLWRPEEWLIDHRAGEAREG